MITQKEALILLLYLHMHVLFFKKKDKDMISVVKIWEHSQKFFPHCNLDLPCNIYFFLGKQNIINWK